MSLQVWLPLNGSFKNQGLSDLTFTASNLTHTTTDGKLGSCYTGNGSNGTLMSTQNIDLGNHQSMFCWMKATTFATNPIGICTNHHYVRQVNMGLTLVRSSSTQAYLSVSLGKTNGRDWSNYKSTTLLNAGTWYHVGYTYDGEQLKLYINGQLDASYNITNIQTGPAPFGCYLWAVNHNGYYLSGHLNDVRVYDHTLSTKEIKEIAKGKMIHYTFNGGGYDGIKNILTPLKPGASAANIGWNAALHQKAIYMTGWSNGYNSGVSNPTLGYHAHWEMIDGIPTMVFPRLNYSISGLSASRWLGINESGANHSRSGEIVASTTYTVSFEAMADTEGRQLYGGYYYSINGTSRDFHDGSWYANDIPVGKWKKYAFTFKSSASLSTALSGYFYFYGQGGGNGIAYLRNPQVEIGSVSHDLIMGTKPQDTMVYDSSGMNYNATISGTLISQPQFNNDSSDHKTTYTEKNYFSAKFNGSTYVAYDNNIAIPDCFTMAFWIKKSGNGHAIDWRAVSGEAGVQPMYFNGPIFQYYSSADRGEYFDYQFTDNTWYHVALVATTSTITLYVNGVKQQTKNIANPTGAIANLHLGCRASYTNKMNMEMKDFRLYSTVLDDASIKQLYAVPLMIDNKQNVFANTFREGDS